MTSRTVKTMLGAVIPAVLALLPGCTGYDGHDRLSDDTPRYSVDTAIGPEMIGPSSSSSGGLQAVPAPSGTPTAAGGEGKAPAGSGSEEGGRPSGAKGESPKS